MKDLNSIIFSFNQTHDKIVRRKRVKRDQIVTQLEEYLIFISNHELFKF